MREISFQTIKRTIELYFKGHKRDVIARKTGVSTGTVSNVMNLLPGSLKELRTLSVELRKSGKSLHEALEGAKLCRQLKEMNVEPDQLSDFIRAVKKLSRNAGYQPKQVVQSAIVLSDLEEKSGKSYPEAIKEFEAKTEQTQKLERTKLKLGKEIEKKDKEREQKLRLNRTTEKEIRYVKELRQELRKQGISLTDAESLEKYLRNMQETGGNPRKFVKFTRKHGSLKGRLTYLENQKQKKTLELDRIKKEKENVEAEISLLKISVSELRADKGKIIEKLETLKTEVNRQNIKLEGTVASLAEILRVKANVEDMNKAINARAQKLHNLEIALSIKQTKIQELERKKKNLEREVEDTLKIKNYAVELKKAVTDLEQQKSIVEKEVTHNKDRIALADTITNFLKRQPTYDFNRLYSMVETVKRTREDKSSPCGPLLPRIEEGIRMQALEAFKGDLVPKFVFQRVSKQKEEIENKSIELEKKLELKTEKLTHAEREIEMLEKINAYVEGGPRTLKELREWMVAIFKEEIERRANEKYDALAAGTRGVLGWIHNKTRQAH